MGKQSRPKAMSGKELRNAEHLAARVAKARTSTPPRGTEYYVLAGELAALVGADVADVLDEFDERAGCREFVGGLDRAEAERLAWHDTEERYTRQRRMTA
jgi:hypothetical protein